jgi:hypothetical protein
MPEGIKVLSIKVHVSLRPIRMPIREAERDPKPSPVVLPLLLALV